MEKSLKGTKTENTNGDNRVDLAQQLIGGMVKENTALIDNFKNQFRTVWR